MRLISGTQVTVTRRVPDGTDRYNAPTYATEEEAVADVLPQPGSAEDLDEGRPEGVRVDMTFHFPKGYGRSLRGCTISYAGRSYRVIGDPQPYLEADTPGPWSMAVETEAVDG